MSEAKKFDIGKPMFTALFTKALASVIRVMTFGATKYGKFNYLSDGGLEPSRLIDAAMRHTMAWWDGELKDPESGESHLAHAICCLGMLLEYELRGFSKDDRFKQKDPEDRIGCFSSKTLVELGETQLVSTYRYDGGEDDPVKVITNSPQLVEPHPFDTTPHPLDLIRKGRA